MDINLKEAEKLLIKWQKTLKLQDWDIKVHIVNKEWRKSGDIKIDESNRQAILMLNNCNPKMTNVEDLVIHELLHLKLWKMDQMIERLLNGLYGTDEDDPKRGFVYEEFMLKLESTTQDLTKAYVELGAEDKKIPFGYVEAQVKEELSK